MRTVVKQSYADRTVPGHADFMNLWARRSYDENDSQAAYSCM
jgi:hypothetical protein